MSRGLLGKKVGMTGVFLPSGQYVPVTVLEVGPCVITQIKTQATDKYDALQLGFGNKKESKVNKPIKGHLKKSGDAAFSVLREFPVEDPGEFKLGQALTVDMFKIGEKVDVTGTSKGRGFSGVIKRHGFHGGRMSHGGHCKRIPGSIGCSAWPARVIPGKKMPGRYGNDRKTVKNLEIIDIRLDEGILLIKGAVPGCKTGVIEINKLKVPTKK